jgi:GxxExxY protein
VPHHRELTERIIGLAIEVHRHSGLELLESFYVAALCWKLRRAGIRVQREVSIPAIYKSDPLPLGFRADETVILEIKAVPALMPAHDMQLQTYLRVSDLPVGPPFTSTRLVQRMARGDSSDNATLFSVAPRGPPSTSVSKNPWPDTHSGSEWRDTHQQHNDHLRRPESFK